jgi:vitamin B12 transporter
LAALGLASAALRAEEATATATATADVRTEPYRLGEVVVTAPPAAAPAGQTTFRIPADEIEARGARTLDEAFGTLSGIDVRTGGGGIPRLFMRGLPPRHAPLYLNGIPINSAADGQFDPRLIPTEDIAEIAVVEGNSSVLYGPGTTAGLIDIVTKKGRGGLHGDARTELSTGNALGHGTSVLAAGDFSGGFGATDFFVGGSHAETPGFVEASGALRRNSDERRSNLFVNGGHAWDDWSAGISGGYFEARQGIPFVTLSDPNNPFLMPQVFERLNDISGAFGQFDIKYQPAGPLSARLSLYANKLDEVDDRYDNAAFNSMRDPTVQTFHQLVNTLVSGARTLASYDLGEGGVLASSLGVQRETESLGGFIRNLPVRAGGGGGNRGGATPATFAVRTLGSDFAVDTYSAAAEYNVMPIARTHVTLGLSQHWFAQQQDRVEQAHQWMGGLAYDVLPELQLNASYSRKVRFPTLQELFDAQRGNPTLRPEKSDDYEAGIVWRPRPEHALLVTAFRNRLNGFIQNDNTSQIFTNKDMLVKGFELAGQARPIPQLLLRAGYTFLDVTDETTHARVDFRPANIFGIESDYLPAPDWAVHGSLSFASGQVVTANSGAFRQQDLPDYTLIDLRVTRFFPVYGMRLWVEANNLANQSYVFAPGSPAPGRTFFAGAAVSF